MNPGSGFIAIMKEGGWTMVFLLFCSLGALAIIVEKAWNLRRPLVLPDSTKNALISLLESGSVRRAREYCIEHMMPLTRLVNAALLSRRYGKEEMREAVRDQGRQEVAALERFLPLLGTVAAVAPLLGLLGTVIGMRETFQVITQVGPGHPDALSGGIAKALITTVTGLMIAIPALVFHNIFHSRVGRYVREMESFALRIIQMLGSRLPGSSDEESAMAIAAESGAEED